MRFLFVLVAAMLCMMDTANAQTVCGPYDVIKDALKKNVQEVVTSLGVASNGSLFQVFSSPTGTWTAVVTKPGGLTCFVASGDGWQVIKGIVAGQAL